MEDAVSKIIGLHGDATTKGREPIPAVVEVLEQLLERARTGDLRQLAFVYVDGTGRPTDGYVPGAPPEELIPIIGGLELCKATLLSQMVDA
jgi:hypothetical protein